MIPTEIINIILIYISELNNSIIITQYHPISNKVYYKINFNSDLLWKINSTILMKRIYPVYLNKKDSNEKNYIELYKYGIPYYEKLLRENNYIN